MNKVSYIVITLGIMLVCSVAINVYFYTQNQSIAASTAQVAFNNEFGNVLIVSPNYNFSPPITMYQALKIALESDSWNATSLENMTVTVSLDYMEFLNSSTGSCSELIHEVTNPAPNYSDMQVNSTTTYRYIWSVEVNRAQGFTYPPFGYYLVDAQTGELVPHEPLY